MPLLLLLLHSQIHNESQEILIANRYCEDDQRTKSELKYNHRSEMITRGTPTAAMHTKFELMQQNELKKEHK